MSKHSKIPISTNLKNQGYSSILFKAKNSSSTIPTVLKDQIAEISSDQNSETSNFFNYDTKNLESTKMLILYTLVLVRTILVRTIFKYTKYNTLHHSQKVMIAQVTFIQIYYQKN